MSLVRDFNLFPETETLLTLERKYGDSLNFEDLHGKPGKSRKKKIAADDIGSTGGGSAGTMTAFGNAKSGDITHQTQGSQDEFGTRDTRKDDNQLKVVDEADIRATRVKIDDKRKADTDANNMEFEATLKQRMAAGAPDF